MRPVTVVLAQRPVHAAGQECSGIDGTGAGGIRVAEVGVRGAADLSARQWDRDRPGRQALQMEAMHERSGDIRVARLPVGGGDGGAPAPQRVDVPLAAAGGNAAPHFGMAGGQLACRTSLRNPLCGIAPAAAAQVAG